jgi:hypothetical protein
MIDDVLMRIEVNCHDRQGIPYQKGAVNKRVAGPEINPNAANNAACNV